MSYVRVLTLLLGIALLGMSCSSDEHASNNEGKFQKEGRLTFYGPAGDTLKTIVVQIADTDPERKRGLMHQRSLGYNRGMLFLFDEVDNSGMWMKNTPLPLDIVFVAPDSQVINIAKRTTPFSEKSIDPDAPNKFAVEVRAGFADRFGITDSSRIRWTRTD